MLISSKLPSSRVIVMREGRQVGELGKSQINQEAVLRLMAGVTPAN